MKVRFVGSGDTFGSGGRHTTCILVDDPGVRFAIDYGSSTPIALNQQGIHHNTIDAIILTHFHGDHYGGVPYLLMDAMLGAKRDRPLIIAGPEGAEARLKDLGKTIFPGSDQMTPKFPLEYIDLELEKPNQVLGLTVTPYPAKHTQQTEPTAVRIEVGDKVIAYTGDGAWTEYLPAVGKDADLLIAECYFYEKPINWHLNYSDIREHMRDFGAKRIILTHMSQEMLAHKDAVPEECAEDGLVIEI